MRKLWFAIIDIVLVMTTISYADSDGEWNVETMDSYNDNDDGNEDTIVVGDMLLTRNQLNYLYSTDSSQRLGLVNPFRRWPNASVFYEFDKSLDRKLKRMLTDVMNYIQDVSCVRFIERDEKTRNYVLIKKGKACSSKIGMRQNGPQQMLINANVCTKGNVIHEFLHTLGFLHMHTAHIRDEYININWDNIMDDAKLNFKQFQAHVGMFDTQYDYDSITHYSNIAFAKNNSIPTIIAKKPAPNMGQRKEMSTGDIIRLNRMYECPNFEGKSLRAKNLQFSNGSIKKIEDDESSGSDLSMDSDEENDMDRDDTSSDEDKVVNDEDEDDMILSEEQKEALFSPKAIRRNGLKNTLHHWPRGIVPFEIDPTFPKKFVKQIVDSMKYIELLSCIKFVRRTMANPNYVYITKGQGCSSEVGMRRTGRQYLNINTKLCPRGKIIHELLHTLGFLHMHTANERDKFIKLDWNNIKPEAAANFKQFVAHVTMFNTPYDYNSIMHYSARAFSIDKSKPTIIPVSDAPKMGQREGMSEGDITRLNRMYQCPKKPAHLLARSPRKQQRKRKRVKYVLV